MQITDPETGALVAVKPAKPTPCAECPWRRSNWGRTDTSFPEFNTPERRSEMWADHPERPAGNGVRDGITMLCHQGAPPGLGGVRPASTVAYECAGSVVLKQRELLRYLDDGQVRPGGLTLRGLRETARGLMLRRPAPRPLTLRGVVEGLWSMTASGALTLAQELPRDELLALAHPAVVLGHDDLAAMAPCEFARTAAASAEAA